MKRSLIVILLLVATTSAFSQELRIAVSGQSFDQVLRGLNVEISFDNSALSKYRVTANQTFTSPQSAIEFLLRDKPFVCQQIGGVYVISPKPQEVVTRMSTPKPTYHIRGRISDIESSEGLPMSYIETPKGAIISDSKGLFNITLNENKPVALRISYLGYLAVDTVLNIGVCDIQLIPKTTEIPGVVVTSSPSAMMMQSGATSGEIRINHNIARFMPGSPDNSVFTLLRMMAGVRASGEPSEDLIAWGSGAGESRVNFDGFTLFGMKNFNDNIGSVNPYMVKDIRLMKGGYGVQTGGRVGAVADITGIAGRTDRPVLKANISNLTANVFGSVPLTKRSSLMAAYRQTYYNLYDQQSINPYGKTTANGRGKGGQSQKGGEIYVQPDYGFSDVNLKLSGETFVNDNYKVSLYAADDKFNFSVVRDDDLGLAASQTNRQYGGAAEYNRVWSNGAATNISLSFSRLNSSSDHIRGLQGSGNSPQTIIRIDNMAQESAARLSHSVDIGTKQRIEMAGEWMRYETSLNKGQQELHVPTLYAKDNILLGKLSVEAGVRIDMPQELGVFVQPRLSARYAFSTNLIATASWGQYAQYMSRLPFVDSAGGDQLAWQVVQNPSTGTHTVAGLAYSRNGWLVSVEGYMKQSKNAVRFAADSIYITNVESVGADLFVKKELGGSTLFGSYSVVSTSGVAPEVGHEIKLGGVVSLSRFHLSANYVYGTGFANISALGQGKGNGNMVTQTKRPYSRLDFGASYRSKIKSCVVNTGVSVLNVFDTQNIKQSYSLSDRKDVTKIYTRAVPFTPMLFIEIIF